MYTYINVLGLHNTHSERNSLFGPGVVLSLSHTFTSSQPDSDHSRVSILYYGQHLATLDLISRQTATVLSCFL